MSSLDRRYIPDTLIRYWNWRIANRRPDESAAGAALMLIVDRDMAQVIQDIDATGVTLLYDPLSNAYGAVIAPDAEHAQFSNDPWYWEGLTYKERPA